MQTKKKVLAIDDHEINLEIIEEVLDDEYNFKTATTGKEALKIAADFRPDIVLLDIVLPDMDGYAVCQKIRSNPALKNTRIIMVSAKAMTSERIEGYQAGANVYISKPFNENELMKNIRQQIRLADMEKEEEPIVSIINGRKTD
jgi:PleD family two-component response regulator